MKALLAKDLRLALDMLLPWGLIVGGFVVGMLVLVALPPEARPEFAVRFGVADVLLFTILIVGLTSFAAAAWAAVCVTDGERRHGAHALGLSLPVCPVVRALSKHVAIVLSAMAPTVVVVTAAALDPLATIRDRDSWQLVLGLGLWVGGACAVAASLGLFVASFVRGAFSAVLVTMLLGGAGALAGVVGMRVGLLGPWIPYREFVGDEGIVELAWSMGMVAAGVAGATATGLLGFCWGTAALIAPLRPGTRAVFAPVALVVAALAGVIAAHVELARVIERRHPELSARIEARGLDDAALAEGVRRIDAARRAADKAASQDVSWEFGVNWLPVSDWAVLEEARSRALEVPAAERDRSPLVTALREAMATSSLRLAVTNHLFAPPYDPAVLPVVLESVRLYPDEITLWFRLAAELPGTTGMSLEIAPNADLSAGSDRDRVDAALRPHLEKLLEGDFGHKELVREVLGLLGDQPKE